jgi:hypothetical protein
VADEPVDIYTLLHKAIWTALQAHAPLTDLVAVRNFVDMTADDFDEFPPNTPDDATPEIAIIQGAWTQGPFSTASVGVNRTQSYNVIVTGGGLSPIDMNKAKERFLDALLLKGTHLGLSQPINGTTITGWSVAGNDSLVPVETSTGEDRQAIRSQAVGTVTISMLKNLPRRAYS